MSHCSSSFKVSFDFVAELCVVAFELLIEHSVSFVDWSDIFAFVLCSCARKLVSFLNSFLDLICHKFLSILALHFWVFKEFWQFVYSFFVCLIERVRVENIPAKSLFGLFLSFLLLNTENSALSHVLLALLQSILLLIVIEFVSCLISLVLGVVYSKLLINHSFVIHSDGSIQPKKKFRFSVCNGYFLNYGFLLLLTFTAFRFLAIWIFLDFFEHLNCTPSLLGSIVIFAVLDSTTCNCDRYARPFVEVYWNCSNLTEDLHSTYYLPNHDIFTI